MQRTDPLEAPGEPMLYPLWEHLQRQPVPPQRASGGGSETTAHQCWSREEIQCHLGEEADPSERVTGGINVFTGRQQLPQAGLRM